MRPSELFLPLTIFAGLLSFQCGAVPIPISKVTGYASFPALEKALDKPVRAHALTISGGASLGAYEAGFNWALLQYLKVQRAGRDQVLFASDDRVELLAVTGASAGNMNAVLSAIQWCQYDLSDTQDTAEDNLFWNTWVPPGWEGLFPENRKFREDDGLLSRNAFLSGEQLVKARVAQNRFRACQIHIGIPVSRVVPQQMPRQGQGWEALDIPNQRSAVLLTASSEPGKTLEFQNYEVDPEKTSFVEQRALVGEQWIVAPSSGEYLDVDTVLSVVRASSAFPLAFSSIPLSGWAVLPGSSRVGSASNALFFDGGLFDNIPVGLSIALAEHGPKNELVQWYVDPDKLRNGSPAGSKGAPSGRGFGFVDTFLSNFVPISRRNELQAAVRFGDTRDVHIEASSRFSPVVGEYLSSFGAFFGRSFRHFDYAVGVYDAMHLIASRGCAGESGLPRLVCRAHRFQRLASWLRLGEEGQTQTGVLVRKLYFEEARYEIERLGAGDFVPAASSIEVLEVMPHDDPLTPVLGAIWSYLMPRRGRVRPVGLSGFLAFVQALRSDDRVLRSAEWSDTERLLLNDPEIYFNAQLREIADRLLLLEKSQGGGYGKLAAMLQAGINVYSQSVFPDRLFDLDPSSIPDGGGFFRLRTIAHLLPYYATLDLLRGGAEIGYRPTLVLSGKNGVAFPLAPFSHDIAGRRVYARFGLSYVHLLDSVVVSSFEIGPYLRAPLVDREKATGLGGEITLGGLLGHLRGSVTLSDVALFRGRVCCHAPELGIHVGLSNLNGLLYWGLESL